jgi:hypothetical protein
MTREKPEPWHRENVDSFLRLLEKSMAPEHKIRYPLSPQQVAAEPMVPLWELLSLTPAEERYRKRVENAWTEIKAHSVYQWLEKQPVFCTSWKFFQRSRAKAKPHKKMAAADAPFIILHVFVEWAAILHDVKELTRKSRINRGATSSRRRTAIKHAEALIQLSDEGVQLSGIDSVQLRRLLIKFIREIGSIKRKRRADKNSTLREVLEYAAYQFLLKLELTYPSILANLAALSNVDCPIKNAQRYFAAAKRKHQTLIRDSLVDALRFTSTPDR